MLRALVLALLVANLGFFAWTEGWLERLGGGGPRSEREPERLLRQVRPESVRVIPPGAPMPGASAATRAAAAPLACLESAPMSAAQVAAADAALGRLQPPLPGQSWTDEAAAPASWLVYMGRYAGAEALARKEDELRRRHLDFEVVQTPPNLAPGLALGQFPDRAAADAALAGFGSQGIHTARVVSARAPEATRAIRFAALDAVAAAQVAALRGDVYGGGFTPCGLPAVGTASSAAGTAASGPDAQGAGRSGASAPGGGASNTDAVGTGTHPRAASAADR